MLSVTASMAFELNQFTVAQMTQVWFLLRCTWVLGTVGQGTWLKLLLISGRSLTYMCMCLIPRTGCYKASVNSVHASVFVNLANTVAVFLWQILRTIQTLIFPMYVDIILVTGRQFWVWYFHWLHCLVALLFTGSWCRTSCFTPSLSYTVVFPFWLCTQGFYIF